MVYKNLFAYAFIAFIVSMATVKTESLLASTGMEKPNYVLSKFEQDVPNTEISKYVDTMTIKMIERSTTNVDPQYVKYVAGFFEHCDPLRNYAGKRLTNVQLVNEGLLNSFIEYRNIHCE